MPSAKKLRYAIEPWGNLWREGRRLFVAHWQEIAPDLPIGIDAAKYSELQDAGALVIVTARADGELVGYCLAVLGPHAHHCGAGVMACAEAYYLDPAHRRGLGAARLFLMLERALRERHVAKIYLSSTLRRNAAPLFEHLGYTPRDIVLTKSL